VRALFRSHGKALALGTGGSKGKNARALFLLYVEAVSVVAGRRPAGRAGDSSGAADMCAPWLCWRVRAGAVWRRCL